MTSTCSMYCLSQASANKGVASGETRESRTDAYCGIDIAGAALGLVAMSEIALQRLNRRR